MSPACKPPEPPLLLATDLDGTLIDEHYRYSAETLDLLEALQDAGVVVALATSKTLDEALLYARRLGLRGDCPGFIVAAEEGALVYASSERLLPWRFEALVEPLSPAELRELMPAECRESVRSIDMLAAEEIAGLTGLSLMEAEAARLRRYVAALYGPRSCLEAVFEEARSRGYYARLGSRFLMVGRGGGKEAALRYVRRWSPALRSTPVLAVGDSEMDRGMLEEADYAIVIPSPGGGRLLLHRGSYTVASVAAPRGWVEALQSLLPLLGVFRGFS